MKGNMLRQQNFILYSFTEQTLGITWLIKRNSIEWKGNEGLFLFVVVMVVVV
jgi:hypothetical protein